MRAEETSATPGDSEPVVLVDTHAHLHRCFDIEEFLDAAYHNFTAAAKKAVPGATWSAVLCLTESAGTEAFAHLRDKANRGSSLSWRRWFPESTREPLSVRLRASDGRELLLVAGYQLRTAERLEVLAVGARKRLPDGRNLSASVTSVQQAGATAIVPWGFGKWTGARRDLVRDLIDREPGSRFFLGDNANRSRLVPRPTIFMRAEERGIPVVPGSDPLPMPSEKGVGGRAGVVLFGRLDPNTPAEDLLLRMADIEVGQPSFIRQAGIGETIRNQLLMQIQTRTGTGPRMISRW